MFLEILLYCALVCLFFPGFVLGIKWGHEMLTKKNDISGKPYLLAILLPFGLGLMLPILVIIGYVAGYVSVSFKKQPSYLIVRDTKLPYKRDTVIENGFRNMEEAIEYLANCREDLIQKCRTEEFYPEYFKEFDLEYSEENFQIASFKDPTIRVEYYIKEVMLN